MSLDILIYIAIISLIAIILTIYDKKAARKKARRVRERTSLFFPS